MAQKIQFHHMGFVVEDVHEAARHWHAVAGVGPFLLVKHFPLDLATFEGEPMTFDHSAAFAQHGDHYIELQQLHHVDPGRDRVGPVPAGLNHLAYAVQDLDAESAQLTAAGLPATLHVTTGDVEVRWQESTALGCSIELHRAGPGLDGFFAAVDAATLAWDGEELVQVIPAG